MSGTISWDELKSFIERMEDEHDFELSEEEWEQMHGFSVRQLTWVLLVLRAVA